MTPEQVREHLLQLHDCTEDFLLLFSGKKNRRRNGAYFPAAGEIVIENRNFEGEGAGDNRLFYTAMHELAHHIQFTEHGQKGIRSHTKLFYSILDGLADKAEELGLYQFDAEPEIKKLIGEAAKISAEIAALQRELGAALNKLHGVCLRKGVRYEDVLKRKVRLSDRTDKKLQKIAMANLPEDAGFEIQEIIAGAKNAGQREAMLQVAADGKSAAQVKQAGAGEWEKPDELEALVKEKERINKTIGNLTRRLKDIITRITQLEGGG
jgi:hypothetical protein